jgi:hypothetical protein
MMCAESATSEGRIQFRLLGISMISTTSRNDPDHSDGPPRVWEADHLNRRTRLLRVRRLEEQLERKLHDPGRIRCVDCAKPGDNLGLGITRKSIGDIPIWLTKLGVVKRIK